MKLDRNGMQIGYPHLMQTALW